VRLWRISNYADLSGEGGRLAAGRWNRLGRRVVYLAEHPALALLETLVHLEIDAEDMPSRFRLLSIEAPDDIALTELPEAELDASSPDWRGNPVTTRALAEDFFDAGRHVLLRVPSVLVPEARNVILNPAHSDAARLRVVSDVRVDYDERLLRQRLV
jgi:RES domain-containing protein